MLLLNSLLPFIDLKFEYYHADIPCDQIWHMHKLFYITDIIIIF